MFWMLNPNLGSRIVYEEILTHFQARPLSWKGELEIRKILYCFQYEFGINFHDPV